MMRNFLIILLFCTGFVSCNKPREIPDDKLEAIVHDMFVANAFLETDPTNFSRDSLNIYAPIFKKYGYRPKDLLYTIDNLSKRKSIRFTDILDRVIITVTKESARYDSLVALRDTTNQRIINRYRTLVYSNDSTKKATKKADLEKMLVSIPVEKGTYEVNFTYYIDSTNLNPYIQYHQWTIDSLGKENNHVSRGYTRNIRRRESIRSDIRQTDLKELKMDFARITSLPLKTLHITIDSIRVYHSPTLEAAKERLMRDMFNMDSLTPPKLRINVKSDKTNFVSLPADTTGFAARRDSVVRQ